MWVLRSPKQQSMRFVLFFFSKSSRNPSAVVVFLQPQKTPLLSCEIKFFFVETHPCKMCVILRSHVARCALPLEGHRSVAAFRADTSNIVFFASRSVVADPCNPSLRRHLRTAVLSARLYYVCGSLPLGFATSQRTVCNSAWLPSRNAVRSLLSTSRF